MAILTEQERLECRALWNDLNAKERLSIAGLTKADMAAAVNALDVFFDTNVAAINAAIPQPARTALTVRQKALLVVAVIRKRYGV